jgi:hypothetical protein
MHVVVLRVVHIMYYLPTLWHMYKFIWSVRSTTSNWNVLYWVLMLSDTASRIVWRECTPSGHLLYKAQSMYVCLSVCMDALNLIRLEPNLTCSCIMLLGMIYAGQLESGGHLVSNWDTSEKTFFKITQFWSCDSRWKWYPFQVLRGRLTQFDPQIRGAVFSIRDHIGFNYVCICDLQVKLHIYAMQY